jgi:hypothetical protein
VLPQASAGAIFHESMRAGSSRDDLRGDAERPRRRPGDRRTRACPPSPASRRSARPRAGVDVARLADRLPAVERLRDGRAPRALLDDPREPEEVLRALRRRELDQPFRNASRAAATASATSLLAGLRDLEERLLGRGRDRSRTTHRSAARPSCPPMNRPYRSCSWTMSRASGAGRVLPLEGRGQIRCALLDLGHQSIVK